jgi:hypothetical protein
MRNTIPTKLVRVFSLAEVMADGCNSHEVAVGLMLNKEVPVRADLADARGAETLFQVARTGKRTAQAALRAADALAILFITMYRELLKPQLGNSYSQAWDEAGFVGSLAIPATREVREELLMTAKTFLTAHPTYEADQVGITADAAEEKYDALSTARSTVNACRGDVGTRKAARATAVSKLRKRLVGLKTELTQLLPGDDARWNSFGLNMPAAVGLPDVPTGLVVMSSAPQHLLGTWEAAPLADRYHVFIKIVGVDSEFRLVKTVTGTEADLNTFTSGQVVRVRVTAVNDGGESLPSDMVEQTVP